MAIAYDEYGNPLYDDGQDAFGAFGAPGGGFNQTSMFNFMQQPDMFQQPSFAAPAYSTSKWNFGSQLPMGQPQLNQEYTGAKNYNQLLTNPSVLYNAEVGTGQQTMDPDALSGLDQFGNPYGGGGGGGGFGGGGAGGGGGGMQDILSQLFNNQVGYKPIFTTPNLDRLSGSDDPISQLIVGGLKTNQSAAKIKNDVLGALKKDPIAMSDPTGSVQKNWLDQVDSAFGEFNDQSRNSQLGDIAQTILGSQGTRGGEQNSPIQDWMGKQGLINPMQQYTADNLPGDVDLSGGDETQNRYMSAIAGNRNAIRDSDANLDALRRQFTGENTAAALAKPTNPFHVASDPLDVVRRIGALQPRQAVGAPNRASPGLLNQSGAFGNMRANQPSSGMNLSGPGFTTNVQRGDDKRRQDQRTRQQQSRARPQPRYNPQQQRRLDAAQQDANTNRAWEGEYKRQAADASDMHRFLVAQSLTQQGRTPARDAQRAVINYLRQGGMAI